jgi:hypothetical protein
MKYLSCILLVLHSVCSYAQPNFQKLIAAEYWVNSSGLGNFTYVVAYNFSAGILQSKDTLIGLPTEMGPFPSINIRFDLGRNFIYRNRYIISGSGNVIDTKTRSLVVEASDDFVEARGDTLIFHRNNVIKGTGFLALDLKTGRYDFINHEEWDRDRDRRTAPDRAHYLSIDQTELPYKVCLHDTNGKEIIVVPNAGHGPNITSGGQRPTIETGWLNNHSFLYAIHQIKHLDSGRMSPGAAFFSKYILKATLRKYNIHTGVDDVFCVLDNLQQGDVNGRFFKDGAGQIIYRSSGLTYHLVDTIHNTLADYPFYKLGYGFSIANRHDKDGNVIRFDKVDIGRLWCANSKVAEGIMAVEYGPPGSNLGYPKGIMVWSRATNTWLTINIPWLCHIIGWIEERDPDL